MRQREETELQKNAAKFRRVYSNPEALDTLCILAGLCKWGDTLESVEDMAKYNAFVHYLAYFGNKGSAFGIAESQRRSALAAFINVGPQNMTEEVNA